MSGAFDPVSGRPTGSATTAGSKRGLSLPSGSVPGKKRSRPTKATRRDKRNSKGGRGTGLVIIGLVVGLGLIAFALIPRGTNGSEAAADPTTKATPTTTTTSTTPSTTTTTTTAVTTTTTRAAGGWQAITATDKVEYDVPPAWTPLAQFALPSGFGDNKPYAVLHNGAMDITTACTTWPVAAGVYLDESTGPSVSQATSYAKGLATLAFGRPFEDAPDMDVTSSRHIDGDGWMGREVVVHAEATAADCHLTEGVVALLALSTDDEPDHTIMVAAYSGTDSAEGPQGVDEATLRKIVESVRVAS